MGMFYNGASEEKYGSDLSPPGYNRERARVPERVLPDGLGSVPPEGVSIHTSPFLNILFGGSGSSQPISTSARSTPLVVEEGPIYSGSLDSISTTAFTPSSHLSLNYKEPWDTIYRVQSGLPTESLGSSSSDSWEAIPSHPVNLPSSLSSANYVTPLDASEFSFRSYGGSFHPDSSREFVPRVKFYLGEPDRPMSSPGSSPIFRPITRPRSRPSSSFTMPDYDCYYDGVRFSDAACYAGLKTNFSCDDLLRPVSERSDSSDSSGDASKEGS